MFSVATLSFPIGDSLLLSSGRNYTVMGFSPWSLLVSAATWTNLNLYIEAKVELRHF